MNEQKPALFLNLNQKADNWALAQCLGRVYKEKGSNKG